MSDHRGGNTALPGTQSRAGFDRGAVAAHIWLPFIFATSLTVLLGEGWSWTLFAALAPLTAFALRPASWALSSALCPGDERRQGAYRERLKAGANTSLVVAAILGLSIMDVFRLPGAPYWTNQPDAGLSLAAVAVYLVWLASHANVPKEIKAGWREMLGSKGSE